MGQTRSSISGREREFTNVLVNKRGVLVDGVGYHIIMTMETRALNIIDESLGHVGGRVDTLDKPITKAFLTIEARAGRRVHHSNSLLGCYNESGVHGLDSVKEHTFVSEF